MKSVSPFRFVGGKTRLLPTLYEYLPTTCHNYWEPFVGGGALFFDYGWKCTGTAFLADVNYSLIKTYDELQFDFSGLCKEIDKLRPYHYEHIRIRFNQLKAAFEQQGNNFHGANKPLWAALFIAVNHLCFNGVYRENKKGEFNVPVGRDSKGVAHSLETLDIDAFKQAADKLSRRSVNINCIPFHPFGYSIRPSKGDVWFADPPYLMEFSNYTKDGFGLDQHKLLAEQALAHAQNGATVIVCGSDNEASRAVYGEPTKVVELSRTVGHSKRGKATEALWIYNGKQ